MQVPADDRAGPTFTIVLSRPTMNRLMQQTASMRRAPVPDGGIGAGLGGRVRVGRGPGGGREPAGGELEAQERRGCSFW